MKCLERTFSLLIAVLMVTTAFIPAVGAAEPNRAASSVNTAGDSFSGTTTFTAGTSTPASGAVSNGHGTAKAEKDPPLFSRNNWSQPTSWTNTSVDIENAGEPGVDASPAAGAARVVTGSGRTKIKVHDPEARTIRIKDAGKSAAAGGDDELEIRLVNATPDLGIFTEIFEITAHRTITLDGSEDFLATWALHNGDANATRAEWFVWEERSHSIEIPIIEYREVTLESVTPEDTSPVSVTLENITPEDVTLEGVVQEDVTPEYAPSEGVSLEGAIPEAVTVREPYIAGTETVEQSWPEWVPFVPDGEVLNAGETRLFKVVYTKPAEIGQIDINTAPVFRGVACPEMTWWSTAWANRVPVTVTNPPSIDGYPHREVVSFLPGMQSDFDDVRFVTNDGIVLDYWKETYTASDSAAIWVNLPAGATSIWMYYGSSAATDTGSRDNAYILYDDFDGPDLDTTLWTDTTPGAHYFSNGWIYDARAQGAGALVSNEPVITGGEPVIVETHIHADSLPSNAGYSCGAFPWFSDTPINGLLWYPESSSWDRYVFVNGAAAWRPGAPRGLSTGGDYYSTWIITPASQTHTVSGSTSFTDVFTGTTGISSHRMQILGGDNVPYGRVVRMDWIRVRKYVETEPAFTYGTPQSNPVVTTIAVTPLDAEVVEGETVQFTATAYDQTGAAMNGVAFTWASGNETVGTVTADGLFSARCSGTSEISASVGLIHGTAQMTVTHVATAGSAWNWSTDGWAGWVHTASWTNDLQPSFEYGPVMVGDHGEHGADVHLSAGAVIATVEHEFTDPSGVGWDSLTLVARVPGSDVPYGRWMTIEVNDEVVYSESGFSSSDPANQIPKEFHADFPQSGTVRVKISHGQNPAWNPRFAMEYYSLELHPPSSTTSPITIISPHDDTVGAGGNVTVAGNVSDITVSSLTLTHNGVASTVPVGDGNFSAVVNLTAANTIVISGVDSQGVPLSATLLLDGDMLPAAYEQAIGFDPLDADSDCSQWPGDQSGNGVIDGYEIFAGDLPVFAKYRIGADPFVVDTDGDGLTDSFELLKLGTFPEEPGQVMALGDGDPVILAAGTDDDPDGDGLSNLEEQGYGTDPLSADTDKDDLSDAAEISMGTDPCDADTDGDDLADAAEVALGTDPLNPDSNGNGVPDGAEDYWSDERFLDDTLNLTVFGRGYAVANVSVAEVNYTHLIDEEILVSKVYDIGFGDDVESGTIEIAYDPTYVENASRLSIYRFDEDLGTFVNVSSTVDSVNWVVSCEAAGSAKYAIMDSARWDALFEEEPLAGMRAPGVVNYVTVHVTDAVTGNPVSNAAVTFTCLSDGFVYAYVTDSNGYTSTSYSDASNIQYQITKTGYRTFTGLLKADPVYDQEHITIHPSIVPTNAPCGNIDVDTDPDGADIYVDGVLRGGSPHVVVDLLEDDHTVEVKMTGYESASTPVPVYGGQTTPVIFDLSPVPVLGTGTIWVSAGPGGAQVYLDGVYKGVTDENEELTISDVPVGNHRVVIQKDGYIPVTRVVTVELNETTIISVGLNNADLDEDGLLDGFENGYRDGFGRWHTVDPYAIDTDGDGLSDGFEAGESVTDENGTTYFRPRSDPDKADTDDDGLDDLAEFEYGADPFNPDTDGDGLRDGADPDPLTPQASGDVNLAKIGRAIILGATFGETGLPGGLCYGLVGEETASSPYYMVGWIGFSCLPVVGGIADIRDAVQAILNGDPVGAAMNAAGAIPGPGDGIKITGAIVCFTGKFPWKARELGVLLSKEILPLLPDALKLDVWRVVLSARENAIVTKLTNEGYSVSQIQEMVASSRGLTKSFLMKNIGEFNAYPGNLHPYGAGIKKTVIGSSQVTPSYTVVGDTLNANYLRFTEEAWTWEINVKFLDCMIDNSDEIILSVHPSGVTNYLYSNFKKEIDYLEGAGYSISGSPGADGYYGMTIS